MNNKVGIQTYFFVFLVIFIFSFSAYTWKSYKGDYKLLHVWNYDKRFCDQIDTIYNEIDKNKQFNLGLKIIAKDYNTNEILEGYAEIDYINKTKNYFMGQMNFTCQQNLNSDYAIISMRSEGYSPKVFELKLPKNKLVTIEVPMTKHCEGGKNFFENYETGLIHKYNGDKEEIREIMENAYVWFDRKIGVFGLNKTDYKLDCIEGNFGRGGFIRATGVYLNKTPFELYYHYGWCSSAGTACGFDACFTSFSDDQGLYELVKSNLCKKISSFDIKEEHTLNPPTVRGVRVNDTTDEIRKKCLEDGFSKIDDEKKSISIKQKSYRMRNYVVGGETDCLNI